MKQTGKTHRAANFVFCLLAAVLLAVIDQLLKIHLKDVLAGGRQIVVIPHVIGLTLVTNTGASFGMLSGKGILLSAVCVAMDVFFLVLLYKFAPRHDRDHRPTVYAIRVFSVMIMAGGTGNMIDRLMRGYVIDYLQTLFMNFPVFNFADCLIVVGGFAMVLTALFDRHFLTRCENKWKTGCTEGEKDA